MNDPKQTPTPASVDSNTRSWGKSKNSSHRKRLARQVAERSDHSYASALEIVARAAESGRLPARLDPSGMKWALATLLDVGPAAATQPGAPKQAPGGPENLYLVRPFLAVLRQVWQGRVAKEPHAGASRFTIGDNPASHARDIELFLLERDGYITAPLHEGDEWAIARTTDLGDRVLAAYRADTEMFHDGLPDTVPTSPIDGSQSVDEQDRRPYVGDGADGALRSAEIDRSEADCLDATDPRHGLALASAARWERQAARLESTPAALA